MSYNELTPEEEGVIVRKGTEPPFTGEYDNFYKQGTCVCRRCNHLFSSKSKFGAGCGWQSFNESFPNAIKRAHDFDGIRAEIHNMREHLTAKNTKESVNSSSIRFVPALKHEQ
jgi:peptide-methionine (R)-S-oxide reductase